MLVLCFTLVTHDVNAKKAVQVLSFSEAKSHYIVEMIKQVYWPNEQKLTQFNIGVIGNDKEIINTFTKQYSNTLVRNLPLHIKAIKDNDTTKYQVIFVGNGKLSSIEAINKKFPEALVISDGRVSKAERSLSFISDYDNIKITFNIDNLQARGFILSNNLLFFAGSTSDLKKQLTFKDTLLDEMFTDIKNQEKLLAENVQKLAVNKKSLERLLEELTYKEQELANKEAQLIQSEKSLSDISIERDKIIQKIKEGEKEYEALKVLMLEKKQHIKQKQSELIAQEARINSQTKVISNQKNLLYISIGFINVVILISFFLWHVNKLRRKSNSKLRELNEQLYEIATTDSMTGLFNRRHFLESAQLQIAQLQRTKQNCAVLMMDIDLFKNINDTYGHAMGDEAIIAVANVFKENLRAYDLLGRLGGEEYGMFLADISLDSALEIAERLREKTELIPITFQGETIHLTISIGVTEVTPADENINNTLQRADKALYEAKNLGRNRVEVYKEST